MEAMKVILCDKVFADVIKSRIWGRRLSWISLLGTNCHHKYCHKRQAEGDETQGDDGVKTEAEIRVMQPQAKTCWQPPEARRGKTGFFPGASRGSRVLPIP